MIKVWQRSPTGCHRERGAVVKGLWCHQLCLNCSSSEFAYLLYWVLFRNMGSSAKQVLEKLRALLQGRLKFQVSKASWLVSVEPLEQTFGDSPEFKCK